MNYGHVGRPTNEEVKSKKRKKLLKIGIPVIAIVAIIGVIASNNGLNGLMGNETCQLTCEDGWSLDGTVCYQKNVATSEINAYLVGDVVSENGDLTPDGKVTLQDIGVIKNAIENNESLTEEQKLVYDLNGDGNVNESDVSSYSTSTSGEYNYSPKYVCPKQTVDEKMSNGTTNVAATKTITTVDYTLNGTKCSVNTTTRIEKKAACKQEEKQPEVTPTEEEQPEQQTPSQNQTTSTNEDVNCSYDKNTNTYNCGDPKTFYKNVTDVTDIDDEYDTDDENPIDEDMEYDTDDENPIDDDMEYDEDEDTGDAVLNKTSNYLKYADTSSNDWKLGIVTSDAQTGVVAGINGTINMYKDSSCKSAITTIAIKHSGIDVLSTKIFKDQNITTAIIMNDNHMNILGSLDQFDYIKNNVNNNNSVDVYLNMYFLDKSYSVTKNCQKVTIKKGQTTIPKVIFSIKAPKYATMQLDYGKPNSLRNSKISYKVNNKEYNKIPSGYSYKVSIGKPKNASQSKLLTGFKYKKTKKGSERTYKLVGFNLMKGNSYLCYKTEQHNNKDFVWQKSCLHGRILFLAKSGNDLQTIQLADYLKDGGAYTLKAQWKTNSIVIKLKNAATKKAYQRHANLQLYTTKDGCLKKNASLKFGKLYPQSSMNKKNDGVIKISNNLTIGKKYYLRIDISNFYNEKSSPQCIAVKATTKNKDVLLVPKTFDVNYADGSGGKDTMAPTKNKKTDQAITLKKNTYTKKGYKFDHWVASRKVTVNGKKVTQYKGFASTKAKNAKRYSWTTLDNCKKYGYKEYADKVKMNINTPEGNITMHAKWNKKKAKQTKKTNVSTNDKSTGKSTDKSTGSSTGNSNSSSGNSNVKTDNQPKPASKNVKYEYKCTGKDWYKISKKQCGKKTASEPKKKCPNGFDPNGFKKHGGKCVDIVKAKIEYSCPNNTGTALKVYKNSRCYFNKVKNHKCPAGTKEEQKGKCFTSQKPSVSVKCPWPGYQKAKNNKCQKTVSPIPYYTCKKGDGKLVGGGSSSYCWQTKAATKVVKK